MAKFLQRCRGGCCTFGVKPFFLFFRTWFHFILYWLTATFILMSSRISKVHLNVTTGCGFYDHFLLAPFKINEINTKEEHYFLGNSPSALS